MHGVKEKKLVTMVNSQMLHNRELQIYVLQAVRMLHAVDSPGARLGSIGIGLLSSRVKSFSRIEMPSVKSKTITG